MSAQKHRYLVITELYLPTKGGTAVWFDEVYRRLGGKEIHVVTADVEGAVEYDAGHVNSVQRVSLRRHWWLRPESLAMYLRLFFKSLKLGLRNQFDAVHAGRVLPEGLVGWVVARIIRKPFIVYAHGEEITTWRQPLKFRVMAFVYRHADHVIANSDFTRDELEKLGVSSGRITIINPGVDVGRFKPGLSALSLKKSIGMKEHTRLLLSVGRLSRRKGFDQVIKSLPALVAAGIDVKYAIIGIGADEGYLSDLAEEAGVRERVQLLGHVSMEDLPRWYNAADLFVMPNREIDGDTEGFGMVFIEAAACGKPSVAGSDGGTGSAVVNGVTGIRIDGKILAEVTDALLLLLQDSKLCNEMGENALARALSEYDWAMVARKTEAIDLRVWR